MLSYSLKSLAVAGALLLPCLSYGAVPCSRESLKSATDLYIATQTNGFRRNPLDELPPLNIPGGTQFGGPQLAGRLGYSENFDVVTKRLVDQPMEIDQHRSLLDTTTCETFTEAIVADKSQPYALGTRLRIERGSAIAEIATIWTTTGYWGFDADDFLKTARAEDWGTIPAANRDTRKVLESVANAYLDALLQGKADVEPWNHPCTRTAANGSCLVGLPTTAVNIENRHFIIDETMGAVAVFCTFGVDPASGRIRTADEHLFRVENGKVRLVHALTHLLQSDALPTK